MTILYQFVFYFLSIVSRPSPLFPPVNRYRNIRNKSRTSNFSFDFDLLQYQMKFIKNKLSLKFDFSTNFGADKNDFGLQKAFLWQVFHLTGASDQSIFLMKSYYCYLYVNKWDHIFLISTKENATETSLLGNETTSNVQKTLLVLKSLLRVLTPAITQISKIFRL